MQTERAGGHARKWILLIAVLLVLAIAGFFLFRRSDSGQSASVTSAYTVQKGDLSVSVQGTGTTQAVQTTSYTPGTGTVDVVSAVEGDAVQMGALIAVLTPSGRSSGSTNYTNTQRISTGSDGVSSVLAPASGRVKAIHAEENQQVTTLQSAHAPLCYLSGDGQMQVAFDLAQGAACAYGDTVQVLVDGDTVAGEVTAVRDVNGQTVVVIGTDTYEIGQEVTVQDADGNQLGTGTLRLNDPILVVAPSGTVLRVAVEENQSVSSGETLFELVNTGLDSGTTTVTAVWAERAGIVQDSTMAAGSSTGTEPLFALQATGAYTLTVSIDELDIGSISLDQTAQISIDALDEQSVTGTVQHISSIGTASGGVSTYDVVIALDDANGVTAGMSATAQIVTGEANDAVLVPVQAIVTQDGQTYVRSYDGSGEGDTGTLLPISLGLVGNDYAEVTQGLQEGDVIALTVTSSDSLSNMMNGLQMGGMGGQQGERPQGDPPDMGNGDDANGGNRPARP